MNELCSVSSIEPGHSARMKAKCRLISDVVLEILLRDATLQSVTVAQPGLQSIVAGQ
jgi:hypothetical protein